MVTYYVKENEIYKVIATVKCDVRNASGSVFATCNAGETITFKAPSSKISLSDDNAVLSRTTVGGVIAEDTVEHVCDPSIHVTPEEKLNWNTTVNEFPNFDEHINNENIHVTADQKRALDDPTLNERVLNISQLMIGSGSGDKYDMFTFEQALTFANQYVTLRGLTTKVTGGLILKYKGLDGRFSEYIWNGNGSITDGSTWRPITSDLDTHQANDTHLRAGERESWNAKANATHTHTTSDITGLDVGVKRIDYWAGKGGGVEVYDNEGRVVTDASSFSDSNEYKATKDVCLIYTVTNSPGSGQTSDFSGFYYNYPLKVYMTVKVNGSYLLCEAASRRVCSGGIDFIEVHLKAGDEVKFHTSSISTYTGYVRIRLLEFNYR